MDYKICKTVIFLCYFAEIAKIVCSRSRIDNATKVSRIFHGEAGNDSDTTCRLTLAEPNVVEVINGYFEAGTILLRYEILIEGNTGTVLNSKNSTLYQPTKWTLTNSPAGQALLLLKDYFNEMSLYTLGYGTESVVVKVSQTPHHCLESLTETSGELEHRLTNGVLRSFGHADFQLSLGTRACNRHVENMTSNVGIVVYRCCMESLDGSIHCEEIGKTLWLSLLFNTIHFLQVVVIVFSPLFIPQSMYRLSSAFIDYVYKPGDIPLTFNVARLNPATNNPVEQFVEASKHWFTKMEHFEQYIWGMVPGTAYKMHVKEVRLRVKASKIIPEGYVPVGLFSFLRKFLFRCGLRKDIPSAEKCCNTNSLIYCPGNKTLTWYKIGVYLASAVLMVLPLLPWLLRIWFYYSIEESVIATKRRAMINRHLVLSSTGSITIDLSPLSMIFVVSYILVGAEAVLYTVMPRKVKRKINFTIKQCLRDTRATKASDVCADFTKYLCYPFVHYGVLGFFYLPLILCIQLPVLLIISICRTLPLIDLSIRMIVNCLYYILKVICPEDCIPDLNVASNSSGIFSKVIVKDQEKCHKRKNKLTYALSLACCFVTMWLLLLIVSECISFYVECAVYTLIGIILNSSRIMKHIILVLVIAYYGQDCFKRVNNVYLAFNKIINKEVQKGVGDKEIKTVTAMCPGNQPNTAFAVNRTDQKLRFTVGTNGFLKCSINSLLLFLTCDDIFLIPRKILMHIAQKSHFACPKKPSVLYLRAFIDFLSILLFLTFVFIVIFAFGQANNVSSASQALAALGVGFIPLVLRKFLFKSHDSPALDTSNIAWTTMFADAVKDCTCLWDVEDIVIDKLEEINDESEAAEVLCKNEDEEADIKLLKPTERNPNAVDLLVKVEKDELDETVMTLFVRRTQKDTAYNSSRTEEPEYTRL